MKRTTLLPAWKEARLRNWWAGGRQQSPCIAGWVREPDAKLPQAQSLEQFWTDPDFIIARKMAELDQTVCYGCVVRCHPPHSTGGQERTTLRARRGSGAPDRGGRGQWPVRCHHRCDPRKHAGSQCTPWRATPWRSLSCAFLLAMASAPVALCAAPEPASGVREARCSEFQFVASVPFAGANGKRLTTDAYLWIPEQCQRVQGLVLAQQNVAEQALVENAVIRQACRQIDMAIVWFYPAFAPAFEHPEQDGAVLQKALDELAAVSGYEEIATAPWISFGHSTMGQFAQRLANWKPERCIAQIVFKSGTDFTLPNNRQVPLFELGGQFTEWNQQKKDWTEKVTPNFWAPAAISKDRALTQRPMSYLLECGSSHFVMTEAEANMIAMYIRKAAAARLPADADGKLKSADIDGGWVVDLNMVNPKRFPAQPVETAKDEVRNGVWFFDEEMAKAVEKSMNVNWKRKTQVPVLINADGTIPSFDSRGLLNWIPPAPAEDGVTIHVKTAFLEKIPANFTIGAGQPLGHSSKGPIQIRWLGGNVEVTGPDAIRMTIDRRRTVYSAMIWVRHPGDDEYRPSIQPVGTGIISNRAGKPQKITLSKISDQTAGSKQLELQGASNAGLPVEYCVIVGPAHVSGKALIFTGIPPRSRFPIKVTVLAYQYGRSVEPDVQSAHWVEQSFLIIGKRGKS